MGEFGIINNADVMRGAREFTAASEDRKKRKISRSQEDDTHLARGHSSFSDQS
jgi:hypothetical protein